jgi:hypothetical protein
MVRSMKIKIVVSVIKPIPPPPEPTHPAAPPVGYQVFFTEDVVLKRYKRKRPGFGLPKKDEDRYAGIHSGTLTWLRIAQQGDRFFKPGIEVIQYVATYKFNDLPKTPLKKGQITTHGLILFDGTTHTIFEKPNKYALTGGTDAYAKARGEVIELQNLTNDRELYIDL